MSCFSFELNHRRLVGRDGAFGVPTYTPSQHHLPSLKIPVDTSYIRRNPRARFPTHRKSSRIPTSSHPHNASPKLTRRVQPPSSFLIPTTLLPASVPPPQTSGVNASSGQGSGKGGRTVTAQSLIERYGLGSQVKGSVSSRKGKEREESEKSGLLGAEGGGRREGEGVAREGQGRTMRWEDTKEKRERELRDRKERMILQARR